MSDSNPEFGLSIHRTEALADGIYAVAMTLLVIDLKLPDHFAASSQAEVLQALLGLQDKFFAWLISFCVLGFFWRGHQRAYSHVRHTDGRLIVLTLFQLALVSLMPFSCSLLGEHSGVLPQLVYSINMVLLAVSSLAISTWIYLHPGLSSVPMPRGIYAGACLRGAGLIVVSVAVMAVRVYVSEGYANLVFVLMAATIPLSRRLEHASGPAAPGPGRG